MRAKLQRIGNSQGIVIPKPLLAQLGIEQSVDIELIGDHLEVRRQPEHPRQGWSDVLSALPQSALDLTEEDRSWLEIGAPGIDA